MSQSATMGAFGNGGILLTNDEQLEARVRSDGSARTAGARSTSYEEVGTNSRLGALHAAVLLAKLPHLGGWNEFRRENAARYHERFASPKEAGIFDGPRPPGGRGARQPPVHGPRPGPGRAAEVPEGTHRLGRVLSRADVAGAMEEFYR